MVYRLLLLVLLSVTLLFSAVGENSYNGRLPQLKSNKSVDLGTYNKNVVLLNMWASWCPGCKSEMPLLDSVAHKMKNKRFRLIAINIDNEKANAEKYIDRLTKDLGKKSSLLFLYDKEKVTTEYHKVKGFPMTLLIKNGKVIKEYVGSFSIDDEKGLLADIKKALK